MSSIPTWIDENSEAESEHTNSSNAVAISRVADAHVDWDQQDWSTPTANLPLCEEVSSTVPQQPIYKRSQAPQRTMLNRIVQLTPAQTAVLKQWQIVCFSHEGTKEAWIDWRRMLHTVASGAESAVIWKKSEHGLHMWLQERSTRANSRAGRTADKPYALVFFSSDENQGNDLARMQQAISIFGNFLNDGPDHCAVIVRNVEPINGDPLRAEFLRSWPFSTEVLFWNTLDSPAQFASQLVRGILSAGIRPPINGDVQAKATKWKRAEQCYPHDVPPPAPAPPAPAPTLTSTTIRQQCSSPPPAAQITADMRTPAPRNNLAKTVAATASSKKVIGNAPLPQAAKRDQVVSQNTDDTTPGFRAPEKMNPVLLSFATSRPHLPAPLGCVTSCASPILIKESSLDCDDP